MPKHFLSLAEHSVEEIRDLLDTARMVKLNPAAFRDACAGKTLAMIFQKPSLRTRVSFETGMYQLGGQAIYLGPKDIQLHRGESIADTTKVLSRYVHAILARVFSHDDLLTMAACGTVPIINGLSDLLHPCQVLADLLTLQEKLGTLQGKKLTYMGDGNNMAHSILYGGARMGMTVAVAHPRGYAPDPQIVTRAREIAASCGGAIHITEDLTEAATDAHAIYTDVWASMGQEAEREERLRHFAGFTVDDAIMARARPDAVFMHCLPAHRGEEVSASVIDGPQSVVFDQAENRLHAQKAILVRLIGQRRW